jgi:nucleoside-diphosphate kinase
MGTTFIILKPDAVQRGLVGKILNRFEEKGLLVIQATSRSKNQNWCRQHYKGLDTEFYPRVEGYITGQIIIGCILFGANAVEVVRKMIGPTDPVEAPPGTIRGDYGVALPWNLIHASSSQEDVDREIELFMNQSTDCEKEK